MAVKEGNPTDYQAYAQEHQYHSDGGVIQVPLAGATAAHRLIRLHGGAGTRTVTWHATRHGRPPIIPKAEHLSDDTLLSATCSPVLPRPNKDAGGFDWSVRGEYVYAQDTLRTVGVDALPVGDFPFVLPTQDTMAETLGGGLDALGDNTFSGHFNALGVSLFDSVAGVGVWPFLALPAAFTSGDLI